MDTQRSTNDKPQGASQPELADIFRVHGATFLAARGAALSIAQQRALRELSVCQTATLGGHRRKCNDCGHLAYRYNSCRNRSCVKCRWRVRLRWREARLAELLEVEYFHVVLTLPDELAQLARYNPRIVHDILCRAAAHAVLAIGREWKGLRANMGIIMVLHSWGQLMNGHPHVHLLIPGGGISLDGTHWVSLPHGFFLPKKWLRKTFRNTYLAMLKKAYWQGCLVFRGELAAIQMPEAFEAWLDALARREWITHAASTDAYRGSAGRGQTVKYLAHYACGVAMSNKRIQSIDHGQVTFTYKDYRQQNDPATAAPIKTKTLPAVEFIRRFLTHVPENGFRHIRNYGFFAPGRRKKNLERIRQMIGQQKEAGDVQPDGDAKQEIDEAVERNQCPACGKGKMVTLWKRARPRVSDIMAMSWADLHQTRLTEWDEF